MGSIALADNGSKDRGAHRPRRAGMKLDMTPLVDVLDELNLAEGELAEGYHAMNMKRERRFTIAPMDENEQRELARL